MEVPQARDWIQSAAVTYATAVGMPDPKFNLSCQLTHASKATWAAAVEFLAHCTMVGTSLCILFNSGASDLYSPQVSSTGFSNQLRGLVSPVPDSRPGCLICGSNPLDPQEGPLSLWFFPTLVSLLWRVWVLTSWLLFPSYQTPCGSFLTALGAEEPFCWSPGLFSGSCSMCSCSFDVSMGGGEGRSGPSYSTGLTTPPHQALLFFLPAWVQGWRLHHQIPSIYSETDPRTGEMIVNMLALCPPIMPKFISCVPERKAHLGHCS